MGLLLEALKTKDLLHRTLWLLLLKSSSFVSAFFLLINQLPVSEAGRRSIDACSGKAEGDICIKPVCSDNPPERCNCQGPGNPYEYCTKKETCPRKWCAKETCRCKNCYGTLYCTRPSPRGKCPEYNCAETLTC